MPDARLLAVHLLVIAAHAVVGHLLGRFLHPALSVPVAPILSYLWLATAIAAVGVGVYAVRSGRDPVLDV